MGSMSLLTSHAFWNTKLSLKARMCYSCGFMYYIHTAIYVIFTPVIPLIMLFGLPEEIKLINYFFILPSFIYMHIIFPFWHKSTYGIETASVKLVYGWAHLFALVDRLTNNTMEWQPTGAIHKKDSKYKLFRAGIIIFNLIPAIIWVITSLYYILTNSIWNFLPIFILGLYYFFMVLKVILYRDEPYKKLELETNTLQNEPILEIAT